MTSKADIPVNASNLEAYVKKYGGSESGGFGSYTNLSEVNPEDSPYRQDNRPYDIDGIWGYVSSGSSGEARYPALAINYKEIPPANLFMSSDPPPLIDTQRGLPLNIGAIRVTGLSFLPVNFAANCSLLQKIDLSNINSISAYAFNGCSRLSIIDNETTITSIGSYAFGGCFRIKNSLELPNISYVGSYAFSSGTITGFSAPNYSGQIWSNAFYKAHKLREAYFPLASSVGESAFAGCSELSNVVMDWSNIEYIGSCAFMGCYNLSTPLNLPNIKSFGSYAFTNCLYLSQVRLTSTITESEINNAFQRCFIDSTTFYAPKITSLYNFSRTGTITSDWFVRATPCLWSVTFDNATSIGISAFNTGAGANYAYFPKLTNVYNYGNGVGQFYAKHLYLPRLTELLSYCPFNGVEYLSYGAYTVNFYLGDFGRDNLLGGNSLRSIYCSNLSLLNYYDLMNCYNLETVSMPNVTVIDTSVFSSNHQAHVYPPRLSSISFEKLGRIEPSAFQNDIYLQYFNCGYSDVYIGSYAFYGCTSLSEFQGSGIKEIGDYAFAYTGLKSISLASLSSYTVPIGSYAFQNCTNLTTVFISQYNLGRYNGTIGTGAFMNCTKLESLYLFAGDTSSSAFIDGFAAYAFDNTPLENSSYLNGRYGSIYI